MATIRAVLWHTMADQQVVHRIKIPGKYEDLTPQEIEAAIEAHVEKVWVQPYLARLVSYGKV